jgi:hypothetical protein
MIDNPASEINHDVLQTGATYHVAILEGPGPKL